MLIQADELARLVRQQLRILAAVFMLLFLLAGADGRQSVQLIFLLAAGLSGGLATHGQGLWIQLSAWRDGHKKTGHLWVAR